MVVMDAMSGGRTWPTVAHLSEVVGRLLQLGLLRSTVGKPGLGRRDIVDRPVMPGTARSIRVIAEKDIAARSLGCI